MIIITKLIKHNTGNIKLSLYILSILNKYNNDITIKYENTCPKNKNIFDFINLLLK